MREPPAQKPGRTVLRWVLLLGGFYVAVVAVFKSFETTLVHMPRNGAESWSPKEDERLQDVTFVAADGSAIHAWWLPPAAGQTRVLLYCHGKGGNLSHRGGLAVELQKQLGCGVLMFDYPGYGRSDGFPTEAACHAATSAALKWLTDEQKVRPADTLILGESLGGGVAVDAATRFECGGLILASTYTTLPDAAAARFWWLPCRWMMSNRYDNLSKIGRVKCPVLVVHAANDQTIPFWQGEALFAAAHEPKRFVRLDARGHADWPGDATFAAVREFFR